MLICARGQCSLIFCMSSAEPDKGRMLLGEKWIERGRSDIKIHTQKRVKIKQILRISKRNQRGRGRKMKQNKLPIIFYRVNL